MGSKIAEVRGSTLLTAAMSAPRWGGPGEARLQRSKYQSMPEALVFARVRARARDGELLVLEGGRNPALTLERTHPARPIGDWLRHARSYNHAPTW